MRDERGGSGLEKCSNGDGNAPQGDPCILTEDGSANGESGVDDGSDFDESKEAEYYCGDGKSRYGVGQDEHDEEEADDGYEDYDEMACNEDVPGVEHVLASYHPSHYIFEESVNFSDFAVSRFTMNGDEGESQHFIES